MNRHEMRSIVVPALLSAAISLCGCAHNQVNKGQTPDKSAKKAGAETTEAAAAITGPDVTETGLHIVAEVKTVQFDYDSAYLSPETRATLVQNADWLKSHGGIRVQAAGHCDERGTVEYNLALGQRRAQAVKDYYKALGVPEAQVATISYGKEKPLCAESNEDCWQKNRRVETLVAFPQAVSQLPK